MNYILIAPVKNEEEYLPKLAECIVNQTITPQIWVIVDDGSTDKTSQIIEKLENDFDWIYHKTLPKNTTGTWDFSWSGTEHFSEVVNRGYEYAQKICDDCGIAYKYLGKVDADVILDEDYFERLMEKFQMETKLGIASGASHYVKAKEGTIDIDNAVFDRSLPDCPNDGARLYRKACFNEIGGFPLTFDTDGLAMAKARLKGWKTECFKEIKVFATRKGGGGNKWKGFKLRGYEAYCLDYHPILILCYAIAELLKKPHYHALALLYGYCIGLLHIKEKIDDHNLRYYYRHQRLTEIKNILIRELRRIFYAILGRK